MAGLGVIDATERQAERAATLLTASQSLIAKLGLTFPSTQSARLDRHLEAARAQLAEENFVNNAARAQAMSLDQAVKYALDERG